MLAPRLGETYDSRSQDLTSRSPRERPRGRCRGQTWLPQRAAARAAGGTTRLARRGCRRGRAARSRTRRAPDVSSARRGIRSRDQPGSRSWSAHVRRPTPVKAQVSDALDEGPALGPCEGRRRRRPGSPATLALQRAAGNAAVSALMAARLRSPGEQAVADIDGALRELRRDEPAVETVEKGLKAAKAAGVPVDLEGTEPPPSALAVTTTGFGPGRWPPKKPVPPPKKVPAVSPLGKAAAKKRRAPAGRGKGGAKPRRRRRVAGGGGAAVAAAPAPLTADQLLQPPVPPTGRTARGRPGLHPGHGQGQGLRQGEAGPPAGRVEGQGGPGRGARPDRRRRRPGQGGQGRHDGRPAGRARSTRRRSSPR